MTATTATAPSLSENHNRHFWQLLQKPIIGLSPMDGVSDHPFRHIQKKYGKPAVMYTEFTNVEGICHNAPRLLTDFLYDETQRPIVGQIYGTTPEYFYQVAILLCQLGFDGIDINMGCPAKNVESSGAGAALINNPELALRIITATQQGVTDYQLGKTVADCPDLSPRIQAVVRERQQALPAQAQELRAVPVSVKTRIGYHNPVVSEWIPTLLRTRPACIALHGRTLKQQYSGTADWDQIAQAAELCRNHSNTIILGNGDIDTLATAHPESPSIFTIALEHSELFEKTYGSEERYSFLPMRKHLGWYVKSVEQAKEIRVKLFQANTAAEVHEIFSAYNIL